MIQKIGILLKKHGKMGSRGLICGWGASPLPLRGVLKGARSVLERQRSGAAPFFLALKYSYHEI